MQRKRVSIKDLASLADVSAPTVSRALRGEGRMSEDTRDRIVSLAREHGYTPSLVARGLVMRRSHCIGLVVPQFADPFHSEVAQGVEDEARRHGYSLFLASMGVDPERELDVVRTFHGRQVDGIIASSSRVGAYYQEQLHDTDIPIVLLNPHVEPGPMHSIYHNDYQGGCQLLQHLIERGYRRIAFIGNERGVRITQQRRAAWIDTLRDAGLQAELETLGPNGRQLGGVVATERLLQRAFEMGDAPPDAIYCYNDTMAIGALSVLRSNQLRVPQDVAITGFDDIDIAAYTEPPLTTLHQPRHEMGVEAMRMLLSLIEHTVDWETPQISVVTGKLVVREST